MSRRTIAFIALALFGLAGCADNASAEDPVPTPVAAQAMSPAGTWTAAGPGIEGGTKVAFGPSLELAQTCGATTGSWLASADGALALLITSGPAACIRDNTATPAWLAPVVAYRMADDSMELLSTSGEITATLTRSIPADQDAMVSAGGKNLVVAPTGAAATPVVSATQMVGTWQQDVGPPIEFRSDGSWRSSYCESPLGGRWAVSQGEPSLLLAPNTRTSLRLCEPTNIDRIFGGVIVAAESQSRLVVTGPSGQVILTRL